MSPRRRRRRSAWAPPKHYSVGTRRGQNEVNVGIPFPESPGPWVNEFVCICEEHPGEYQDFNSGVTFAEATAELRDWNRDNENTSGGWRSRGPVLYMMSVIKMRRWYEAHAGCWVEIARDPEDWSDMARALYQESQFPGTEQEFADFNNERDLDRAAEILAGIQRDLDYDDDDDDDDEWIPF